MFFYLYDMAHRQGSHLRDFFCVYQIILCSILCAHKSNSALSKLTNAKGVEGVRWTTGGTPYSRECISSSSSPLSQFFLTGMIYLTSLRRYVYLASIDCWSRKHTVPWRGVLSHYQVSECLSLQETQCEMEHKDISPMLLHYL